LKVAVVVNSAAGGNALPVALDGEVAIIETPLHYRVRRRALTVFVPKARDA
jgi:diacylglycerol kinase family enzyme